jgi:hypothetical protein
VRTGRTPLLANNISEGPLLALYQWHFGSIYNLHSTLFALEEQQLYRQGSVEESHGNHGNSNSNGGSLSEARLHVQSMAAQTLGTSAAVRADSRAASA